MAYQHTSQFDWRENERRLKAELETWGVSTYSLRRGIGDPTLQEVKARSFNETQAQATVVLRLKWKSGRELTLTYNKQARSVDNLSVLRIAVGALRLNEKRGIDDVMREAYLQLPAGPVTRPKRSPYEVLNISPEAPMVVAEATYKALARLAHPDAGGSEAQMQELNEAIEILRAQAKGGRD